MTYSNSKQRVASDLSLVWPFVSMPREMFQQYYGGALSRFYEIYPESSPFPLTDRILKLKIAYIIPENVPVELQYKIAEKWTFALFVLSLFRSLDQRPDFNNSKAWLLRILDHKTLIWIGSEVGLPLMDCIAGNFTQYPRVLTLINRAEASIFKKEVFNDDFNLSLQLERTISNSYSSGALTFNRASSNVFCLSDGFFIYKTFFDSISLISSGGNASGEVLIGQIMQFDPIRFTHKKLRLNIGTKKPIRSGYFFQTDLCCVLNLDICSDFVEIAN